MGNAWASWKHGFQLKEDPEPGQGVALLGGYGPPPWGIGEEQPDPAVSPCGALFCHGVEGAEQGWQVRRGDASGSFSWDRTKVV